MKSPVNKLIDPEIAAALAVKDPELGALIARLGPVSVPVFDDHYYSLVMSIVYQQLSFRAAETIFNRFLSRIDQQLVPEVVINLEEAEFRSLGISRQKARYILDISKNFIDRPDQYKTLAQRSDEEVIKLLCEIKGVGRWTAQMFLMFTLMRPDVFPVADLGIRKAMVGLYQIPADAPLAEFETLAHRWAPYRSYACHYLWHAHDN